MTDMYTAMLRQIESGEPAVLATIVRTKGSTPREVGARMIITADGRAVGTIGGGCGEADVWSEALTVLETGQPKLVVVDLVHDDDLEGGRACGGLMYVFVERLDGAPVEASAARVEQ